LSPFIQRKLSFPLPKKFVLKYIRMGPTPTAQPRLRYWVLSPIKLVLFGSISNRRENYVLASQILHPTPRRDRYLEMKEMKEHISWLRWCLLTFWISLF